MKELEVDVFALKQRIHSMQENLFKEDWTARAIALLSVMLFGGYILLVTIQPLMPTTTESSIWSWVIWGRRLFYS